MRTQSFLLMSIFCAALLAQSTIQGEVRLPLETYHQLTKQIEAREKQDQAWVEQKENQRTEVTGQQMLIQWQEDRLAQIDCRLDMFVQGRMDAPRVIPIHGILQAVSVSPAEEAFVRRTKHGLEFLSQGEGRFVIQLSLLQSIEKKGNQFLIPLAPFQASISKVTITVPKGFHVSSPKATLLAKKVEATQITYQMAPHFNTDLNLILSDSNQKTIAAQGTAQSFSFVQVTETGVVRRDLIRYQINQGTLDRLALEFDQPQFWLEAQTQDGPAIPQWGGNTLVVFPDRRQKKSVDLLVSSGLRTIEESMPLRPLKPVFPVESHYLIVQSDLNVQAQPQPVGLWKRVDVSDLPHPFVEDAERLGIMAIWRLSGDPATTTHLALKTVAQEEVLATAVDRRKTTSVLTREDSILHHDLFHLAKNAERLELEMADGTSIWSTFVNGMSVRPLFQGNQVLIPLTFSDDGPVVEVITSAAPMSQASENLHLQVPSCSIPVLVHEWELFLPDDHRYRVLESTMAEVNRHQQGGSRRGMVRGSGFICTISDSSGTLPGVHVLLQSTGRAKHQHQAVTNADGEAVFSGLKAGRYAVTAKLGGFSPGMFYVHLRDGQVGKTEFKLEPTGLEEAFVVTAERPVLDVTSTTAGSEDLVENFFDKITANRNHQGVMEISPGTISADESGNLRIYGASGTGTQYIIDGVNTSGFSVVTGVQSLPIEIPKSGTWMQFSGVMPPAKINLQLKIR